MKTVKKLFVTLYRTIFISTGKGHSCPVCGEALAMQVPLMHICERE